MVGGNKREQKDFTKHVGFFEGKVVAVNPTKEELEKLLGAELEKDIEYVGEDGDGNTRLKLNFRIEDVKSKKLFNLGFLLTDKDRLNQDGTKTQYINITGATTWADEEVNLPSWFIYNKQTQKDIPFRVAKSGEDDFYSFMKTWASGCDWFTNDEFFDWKKLMRGNVSQVAEFLTSDRINTVLLMATVSTQDKDGDIKEYQQVYNKFFTYGNIIKSVRLAKPSTPEFLLKANTQLKEDKKKLNGLQRFVLNLEDETYGCKDFYKLEELSEYDPSENIVSDEANKDEVKKGGSNY